MIRTEKLFKSFGNNEVIKGIDAEFFPGKTNLIIGRSGAGKTVFLKMLVGLFQPTSGHIWYDDTDFFALGKKELRHLRNQIGMLFQGSALFDSMTVEENVRFPLDMFSNWTYKEKQKRVDECLAQVELDGANNKYPSEISGGMQKRVGIARAIVLEPKYLFCDEPNSGLDPKTALLIDELIHKLTIEKNMTTIINTHDMNSVMGIGENILLLADGKKAWQGNKNEVMGSTNEQIQDFIFASPFLQELRDKALSNHK